MKKLLLIASLFGVTTLWSQQITTFSQYMLNPYLINSASAGFNEESSLFLHYRNQWMGFSNSPRTFAVTFDAPVMENSGIGLYFLNQQSHILNTTTGRMSYRYAFTITGDHRLGFGLYGGFMQRNILYSNVDQADIQDPTLYQNDVSGSIFDAGFSIWYQWNKLEAGFAIDQLLNNKFDFEDDITGTSTSFQNLRHFTFNAAYEYEFKDEIWAVKPSVILRSFQGANVNAEVTAIAKWKKMIWAGAGYRQNFGMVFLAGVKIIDQISFGYSYDYSTGAMQNQSSGSHEVMLSYQFGSASGSGKADADTKRRLRKQASDIRDLKAQNEELQAQLNDQHQEIKKLRDVERRDSSDMQKIIDANKVTFDPEQNKAKKQETTQEPKMVNTSMTTNSSNPTTNSMDVINARLTAIENELEELKSVKRKDQDENHEARIKQLEAEVEIIRTDLKNEDGESVPKKYNVVTGAYFSLEDAKTLQKILMREMNLTTKIVSRSDRKFFFVVTKNFDNYADAEYEVKRLKEMNIKKYINGNLWVYLSAK